MAHNLVVHCKKSQYDVYIGRPSQWGNPFVIGKDGNREEVVEEYLHYLLSQPHLIRDLQQLKGKILGCWCSPSSCHGDVVAALANEKEYNGTKL